MGVLKQLTNPKYTRQGSIGNNIQVKSSSHRTTTTRDHRPWFALILVVVSPKYGLCYSLVLSSIININPKYIFCSLNFAAWNLPWTPEQKWWPLTATNSSTSTGAPRADGRSSSPAATPWPRCPTSPGCRPRPLQAAEPRSAHGHGMLRRAKGSNLRGKLSRWKNETIFMYHRVSSFIIVYHRVSSFIIIFYQHILIES